MEHFSFQRPLLFSFAFQNRSMAAQEKKLMRDTSVLHENEKRNLNDQMKKNSKMDKDRMKKVSQRHPHGITRFLFFSFFFEVFFISVVSK